MPNKTTYNGEQDSHSLLFLFDPLSHPQPETVRRHRLALENLRILARHFLMASLMLRKHLCGRHQQMTSKQTLVSVVLVAITIALLIVATR